MFTSWVGKSHHYRCWFRGANAECCTTLFLSVRLPAIPLDRSDDSARLRELGILGRSEEVSLERYNASAPPTDRDGVVARAAGSGFRIVQACCPPEGLVGHFHCGTRSALRD